MRVRLTNLLLNLLCFRSDVLAKWRSERAALVAREKRDMFALRRLGGGTQDVPRPSLVFPHPLPLQSAVSTSTSAVPSHILPSNSSALAPSSAAPRTASTLPERWTALETGHLRADIVSIRSELSASLDDADLAVCTPTSILLYPLPHIFFLNFISANSYMYQFFKWYYTIRILKNKDGFKFKLKP